MFSININENGQQCQSGANWFEGGRGWVKQFFVREWGRIWFLKKALLGLKRTVLSFMSNCVLNLICSSKLNVCTSALKKKTKFHSQQNFKFVTLSIRFDLQLCLIRKVFMADQST